MFKIMKGYKNLDFTPSGKSLKKTLMGKHNPFYHNQQTLHKAQMNNKSSKLQALAGDIWGDGMGWGYEVSDFLKKKTFEIFSSRFGTFKSIFVLSKACCPP